MPPAILFSLPDALPIYRLADGGRHPRRPGPAHGRADDVHDRPPPVDRPPGRPDPGARPRPAGGEGDAPGVARPRSEEHTSELQSRQYFVCRLLLEKKIS